MSAIRLVAIDPGFEIRFAPDPLPLTAAQRREIDLYWEEEPSAADAPDDEPVLCVSSLDRRGLVARWVPRREQLAGQRLPALFHWQPPLPIGIVGCISCEGRVLLGRRSPPLESGTGRWELLPWIRPEPAKAKSRAKPFDFVAPLLARLSDSARIPRRAVERATPFALAYEPYEPAWHLCVALDVRLSVERIRRLESAGTEEHDLLTLARPVDVIEAGLWSGSELDPLSAALVRLPARSLAA